MLLHCVRSGIATGRQHAWKRGKRDYLHAELPPGPRSWRWTLGQERRQGDGRSAEQTPLATLHAFDRPFSTSLALADYRADHYATDTRIVWFTVEYKL